MNKFLTIIANLSLLPNIVLAAPSDLNNLIQDYFLVIFKDLIPVLIGMGLLMFIYGVGKYIVIPDAEARKEAKNVIVYGIIILFVMVSIWGFVRILQKTFDIPLNDSSIGTNTQNINNLEP